MPVQEFPQFNLPQISATPTYQDIIKTLQAPTAQESQFLPEIERVLSERSQFLAPAISQLKENIGTGLANLEGTFARRGLTGSSIEAQGLATATGQGQRALAELVGGFAREGAGTFAQILSRARAGDVQAQRQLQLMFAEAMGQELTAGRDIEMFNQQLSMQGDIAEKQRKSSRFGAITNLIGQVISAAASAGQGGGSSSGRSATPPD